MQLGRSSQLRLALGQPFLAQLDDSSLRAGRNLQERERPGPIHAKSAGSFSAECGFDKLEHALERVQPASLGDLTRFDTAQTLAQECADTEDHDTHVFGVAPCLLIHFEGKIGLADEQGDRIKNPQTAPEKIALDCEPDSIATLDPRHEAQKINTCPQTTGIDIHDPGPCGTLLFVRKSWRDAQLLREPY
jgi:hypothetical protein